MDPVVAVYQHQRDRGCYILLKFVYCGDFYPDY